MDTRINEEDVTWVDVISTFRYVDWQLREWVREVDINGKLDNFIGKSVRNNIYLGKGFTCKLGCGEKREESG